LRRWIIPRIRECVRAPRLAIPRYLAHKSDATRHAHRFFPFALVDWRVTPEFASKDRKLQFPGLKWGYILLPCLPSATQERNLYVQSMIAGGVFAQPHFDNVKRLMYPVANQTWYREGKNIHKCEQQTWDGLWKIHRFRGNAKFFTVFVQGGPDTLIPRKLYRYVDSREWLVVDL
jgi:hypothetical protein